MLLIGFSGFYSWKAIIVSCGLACGYYLVKRLFGVITDKLAKPSDQ